MAGRKEAIMVEGDAGSAHRPSVYEAVTRLHSCPQMAWLQVRETVAEVLLTPDGLILFCGMSIGYEDPAVSYTRTGRAPLDETVTLVGDSELALRASELAQTNHLNLSQNDGMVGLTRYDGQVLTASVKTE